MTAQKFDEITFNSTFASVEYEGYKFIENEKKLCISAASGSITKEEFIKMLLERCTV